MQLSNLILPRQLEGAGMAGAVLRLLSHADATALLEFELANRRWFERFIASRGDYFYWPDGVQAHITHCLQEFAEGRMQPMVLQAADGGLLGRANLHQIQAEEAKLGYRLAQTATGMGLAQRAVQLLIEDARQHWRLPLLKAFVAPQNLASVRVLERSGFIRIGQARSATHLVQGEVTSDLYHLPLTPDSQAQKSLVP